MKLDTIPTGVIDWANDTEEKQPGRTGEATIRMRQFGETRIRLVEFSAGYLADHWCHEGHIVYVVSGNLTLEHRNDRSLELRPGMTYHVGANYLTPHRVRSEHGATIFVVD